MSLTIDSHYDFNKIESGQILMWDSDVQQFLWKPHDPNYRLVGLISCYQESFPGVHINVYLVDSDGQVQYHYQNYTRYDCQIIIDWLPEKNSELSYRAVFDNDQYVFIDESTSDPDIIPSITRDKDGRCHFRSFDFLFQDKKDIPQTLTVTKQW
jgi:hypothetical protein